jgi:hypothetical protein
MIVQTIGAGFIAMVLVSLARAAVAQVPSIDTPKPLLPYASTQDVLKTAAEVIELLPSARVEVLRKEFLSADCDKEEYQSIFRGYQLIKTV